MANDLSAHAGDLITADLWNKLLELIDSVDARITANEARVVPSVVGDLLGTARDEIDRSQLGLDTVLDLEGTRVANPADAAYTNRIVLAQMPAPDDRVRAGRSMSLLVTGPPAAQGADAPVIDSVKPTEGTSARVGKPLQIKGKNFTTSPQVLVRNDQVDASLLTATDTLISISAVPTFEGAPAPGESKTVAVRVTTVKGTDSEPVTFSEPQAAAGKPFISNVRVIDPGTLRVLGTALCQSGQDTNVTMSGSAVDWSAVNENELKVDLPETLARTLTSIARSQTRRFELLLAIDQKDVFLLDLPTGLGAGVLGAAREETPLVRRAATAATRVRGEVLAATVAGGVTGEVLTAAAAGGLLRPTRTVKLLVFWSESQAEAILAASGTTGFRVSATASNVTVTLRAGRLLTIDLTKLTTVSVAVAVGNQSASFPLMVGEP